MAQVCGNCRSANTQTEVRGHRCLECLALTLPDGRVIKGK